MDGQPDNPNPLKYSYPDQSAQPFHHIPTVQEIAAAERASLKNRGLTDSDKQQFRKVVSSLVRKRLESLSLYQPLSHAVAFHASKAPERVPRGSNQSGKTNCAAVEVARAVLGRDPYNKYPKENGRAFLVGKNGKHLGQVMYRKLFRRGAFDIIKNNKTGLFEVYQPWRPEHLANKKLAKWAPPLIPASYIAEGGISWEKRGEQIPSLVRMKNGWEISFFTALGECQQGSDIDLAWMDEEIPNPEWYVELSARLIRRGGKFIWSATPQAGSEQLFDLHKAAEEQKSWEKPITEEYFFSLRDNPYISKKDKDLFATKLQNEEDYRVRVLGEFAIVSFRVFPEFDSYIHGCDPFHVPNNWTRYMVVDPGRQVCAVLFAAVPPPSEERAGHVYLYDQLYIKRCSAMKFATGVMHKSRDQQFYAYIIDAHEGRKAQTGSGITIETAYSEALAKEKLSSQTTGNGFVWGSDDREGGVEAIRKMLEISNKGKPVLQVMREKLTDLEWELERYRYARKRTANGYILTDVPEKKNDHLIDCLRYLAVYEPDWHAPLKPKRPESWPRKQMRLKKEKALAGSAGNTISLGPRQNAYM